MLSKFLYVLIVSIVFLLIPNKAFAADIVINEVFANPDDENNEFIELYNKSGSEVDLSNWVISDKVKTYTISSTTISANGFVSLKKSTTGIELNNSDEEVTLKDSSSNTADTFSYSDTIEGKSWSRVPDGTGSFVNNTSTSENAGNSAPPPTNTPAPTNTPTPTNSPTPTKTPTPKPTSTPTRTPTPPKTSPTPTGAPSPTSNPNSNLSLASENNSNPFGQEKSTPTPQVMGASTSSIPYAFIGIGLIFMAVCGILAYFQFGDRLFVWKKEKSS